MFNLNMELERLLKKYPDPRKDGADLEFRDRKIAEMGMPLYGTVADNKDPQCLGRVRVASDLIAPGAVTPWIPIIALGATKKAGWWQLPDIGTQVLMGFLGKGHSTPVVLGCLYDLKHKPPKHSTEKVSDSKVYQTKAHRVEVIDEEGKEGITISTAKGKIRLTLSKDKGIELINELGDTNIKCRKLTIEGKEGVQIEGKKKVSIQANETVTINATKGIKLSCDKEVTLKGKNIKLEASKGLTTEGKQLAAEGDKVMGFDIHQMVVPSGSGTMVVPMPHPFIGKLADKLSKDVKIKGHNAAVKGSVAKHDSPVHNQLPGTIKFQKGPKKEGEVTGGTGKKVKINGKEVAVIGSTVTTCNDMGAKENSMILAVGASIPMPVIINPKNTKEYNEEKEKEEKKKPEVTAARWGKGTVKEGEKAELNAQVKDIADGNMVLFQVWKEGQDPASHVALRQLPGTIEGGSAKAVWEYTAPNENLPEEDPKFFFTAHTAWCPYKKSDNVTVELKRPELTEAKWQDKDGKDTDKGLVGEALKMSVSCNEDMEEGAGVTFSVYKDGADPKRDKPEVELRGTNQGGKAESEWTYHYQYDPENPLKEKPKYFFTVNGQRCKEVKSSNVKIGMVIDIPICNESGEYFSELEYTLVGVDGAEEKGKTVGDGRIQNETLLPGDYEIKFDWENYQAPDTDPEKIDLENTSEPFTIQRISIANKTGVICKPEQHYLLVVSHNGNGIST